MSASGLEEKRVPLDVLVVDDSPEDIATIRRHLRTISYSSYSIREALSTAEALAECARKAPDCLLLDMRMPDIDGLGFLDRLAQTGPVSFPIIVLTSYGEQGIAATAIRRGAQDFLIKGETTPDQLRRAFDHARERFRMSRELSLQNQRLEELNASLNSNVQRLNAIFSQSSVGIAQAGIDGRFTLANDAFCGLAGRTREQLFAMCLAGLARSGQENLNFHATNAEKQYCHPDGSMIWVNESVEPIRNLQREVTGLVILSRDITAWKLAEAELQEGRERLRFALQSARMGTWEWHISADFVTCSEEIAPFFGNGVGGAFASLESFLGQVDPADRQAMLFQLRTASLSDSLYAHEFQITRPDRSDGWLELQGAVIRDTSGERSRMVGTARDITEKINLQKRLAAAAKFESVGVMAAGLAHDFNNLLVGVIGSASLAQDLLPPDHQASSLLNDIVQSGERAARLTAQMLAYSGKGQVFREPVDLAAVVRSTVSQIELAFGKGFDLQLDLQPGLAAIGDWGQIEQLVSNLLTNAVESLEQGRGRVTVRTAIEEVNLPFLEGVLKTADIKPGTFIRLEIQDTGCGINETIKEKILDPFFSTKFAGRGLGLAASAGIVRAHKGAIHISSKVGAGTTVTLLLPLADRPVQPRTVKKEEVAVSNQGAILVVDDEKVVANVAAASLRRAGYEVLTAQNGPDALELLQNRAGVAVVLLDLTMPLMHGREVLRHIRRLMGNLPVILSSGYSEEAALLQIEGDDVNAFLQKPYKTAKLLSTVRETLHPG